MCEGLLYFHRRCWSVWTIRVNGLTWSKER